MFFKAKVAYLVALGIVISSFTFSSKQALAQKKSQEESTYKTLLGDNVSHGGYGGFHIGATQVGKTNMAVVGGRGSWVIGHSLGIGLAGESYFGENNTLLPEDTKYGVVAGGHGGLVIEPIVMGKWPVHVSFPVLIGAGGLGYDTYIENGSFEYDTDRDTYNGFRYTDYDYDFYFLIQPAVEVEFNLTRHFRMALGANYRITSPIELEYKNSNNEIKPFIDEKDFQQISAYVCFKFGKF